MISSFHGVAIAGMLLARFAGAPTSVAQPDTMPQGAAASVIADTTIATAVVADSVHGVAAKLLEGDTIPRRRAAVHYSDAYGTRVTIHRRLSYAMVPLFALSYFTGDQLLKKGSSAGTQTLNLHRGSATAVAALFTVNTALGALNLWEGRHDPIDRKRKFIHAALMVASDAAFTYAGVALADDAETSQSKRLQHRNVNLAAMGVSVGSSLFMLFGRD